MRRIALWASLRVGKKKGEEENFVSGCYVLWVETSHPVACEKAAVETMYHLQHSACGRRLATLGAAQREILKVLFGESQLAGFIGFAPTPPTA
jgi:hypothetical protein